MPAWCRSKQSPFGVMMPSISCSGVKLTELCGEAVSQDTSRRPTWASDFAGLPYGRAGTPSPSILVQSATFGGKLAGLDCACAPDAAPVIAAAPPASSTARREGTFLRSLFLLMPPVL